MASHATRALRGALAGAAAATVWAVQQPLDRRLFGVDYDDAELLGTLLTHERGTPASMIIGTALHLANGAAFGAAYALVTPRLPGGAGPRTGLAAGLTEHLATWPLTRFLHLHPADGDFPQLWGNHAAFAQATWRHALFGTLLGGIARRLTPPAPQGEPADLASSNGHGRLEQLVTARAE